MKTILSFIVLFISINTFSQTRKLEVTDNQSGKSIFFQEAQRVKITTTKREQLVGALTFENPESITINGMPIPINNINSIKYFPKKGAVLKNIILGTGLGLVAGWYCSSLWQRKCLFIICRRSWNNNCWRTHWWKQNLY
ncbi:hypothetical protein ACLHWR_01385 [Flavobacterium psychrophilum]|uniref:hypothetical protein n=1 Tax=Flavobacterium psychrophilum TaxID=96345 RepID=UPI003984F0D6